MYQLSATFKSKRTGHCIVPFIGIVCYVAIHEQKTFVCLRGFFLLRSSVTQVQAGAQSLHSGLACLRCVTANRLSLYCTSHYLICDYCCDSRCTFSLSRFLRWTSSCLCGCRTSETWTITSIAIYWLQIELFLCLRSSTAHINYK